MNVINLTVAAAGFFLTVFTYWFFFGKKDKPVKVSHGRVNIEVKGGYSPAVIEIPLNKKTTFILKRTDPSSCLEEIVIPAFRVKKFLPLNENVSIELIPPAAGEFVYSCGMNMYHGKIIVS